MSDRDWREAERAWQADPRDGATYEAALAARRRAGVPISGPLLEDLIHPPHSIESVIQPEIAVLTPDREITVSHSLELSAHRAWGIFTIGMYGAPAVEDLLTEAERLQAPGVFVYPSPATRDRLRASHHLEFLAWAAGHDPAWLRELPPNLTRLVLGQCFNAPARPDWSHSLPPLPHLTELFLIETPCELITLTGLARLPSLHRLHVVDPTRRLRGQVHEALPHCRLGTTRFVRIEA